MNRQELERCRRPWPPMFAAILRTTPGCNMELRYIEDDYGCYSTGYFEWKGKRIAITIDNGLWHLSVDSNHTLGYYELKEIRYTFMPDSMYVAQVFPPRRHFVNIGENTFHLWEMTPKSYSEIMDY